MKLALVTGGGGFIGSALVRGLLAEGVSVRVLDNFSSGRRENLRGLEASVEIVEGDIRDERVTRQACASVDVVFHQAALPSVPRSLEAPLESNDVNVRGTLTVLVAARDAGVRRVVYAGSSSAYGDSEAMPKRESDAGTLLSPYAVSKYAGEQYCRMFTRTLGLETVVLRYFNVFGPRQNPASQYAAVIPRFARAILRGEPVSIYGDGSQTRDFTYVQNVVDANLLAARAERVGGLVINAACGGRISLLDLVRACEVVTGRTAGVKYLPARVGDVHDSQADIALARRLLGYAPSVDFMAGLTRVVEWLRQSAE